jgi:predicted ATPase
LSSWYLGRSDESLQLASAAVLIGEQNLYALSTARVQCAFLYQFRDEATLCGEWADQAIELADHQGFPLRALQASIIRGWADAAEGSPHDGVARIAIGLDRYRSLRARLSEPYFIGLHADAELFAGRPDHSLRLLDEAVLNMNETTRSFFFEPELHRLRARAHSQIGGRGAVISAREELDHATTAAELLRSPPLTLRAAIDRLRLEALHGDPEPWREPVARGIAHYAGQADTADVVAARGLLDA